MDRMTLTQAHLDSARAAGACEEALRKYVAGTSLDEISLEHLVWAETYLPDICHRIEVDASRAIVGLVGWLPLSFLLLPRRLSYGHGYGHGYGDGDGDGSGDGGSGYTTVTVAVPASNFSPASAVPD